MMKMDEMSRIPFFLFFPLLLFLFIFFSLPYLYLITPHTDRPRVGRCSPVPLPRASASSRLPSNAHRPSPAPASRRPRAPQPLRLRASPAPPPRAAQAGPRSRFQQIWRRCPADAPPPPSQTRRGQRRPMATMGPATARGSQKKP